jgi:hypothetical protein
MVIENALKEAKEIFRLKLRYLPAYSIPESGELASVACRSTLL